MNQLRLEGNVKQFGVITAGTVIIGVGVYFFLMPSHLALGSVSGLAIVLNHFVPVSVSALTMIMNVSLLIVGFILVGREFGGKTVYTSILLPLTIGFFEEICPNVTTITGSAFSDMICYLFVVSVGQTLLFSQNASSGGLDIVGKIVNKYTRMEIGKAISIAGMCVALLSFFAYDVRTMVLSVLGTYLNGVVLDRFMFGYNMKRRVCIISKKNDEIVRFILDNLHSGATLYEAKGAYTGKINTEINVITDKYEYHALIKYILREDPDAFVTVYNVNEIMYRPKTKAKNIPAESGGGS